MSKSFKELLQESTKDYNYTIKIATSEISESALDIIESCLQKYEVTKASKFKSTPIQESPLDFPQIQNSAVFISDITLSYPASRDMLRTMLANQLGIPESTIVVYSANDPRQDATDMHLRVNAPDFKDLYEPKLATDISDDDCACTDGMSLTDQKMSLLQQLAKDASERTTYRVENPLSPAGVATDDVLPTDYHDFDKQVSKENPGLFGRLKVEKAYNYIRK
jgi:hypothetical protein